MYLPDTYLAAALLIAVSILCWGSWANFLKAAGRWRFELFYYDYSFGALLCAVVAAFTLGTFNSKELTFQDNLLITGYRNMAYAAGAGMIFNLANMLLTAAISASGMTWAFPIAIGWTLAIDGAVNYFMNPRGELIPVVAGAALTLTASATAALAYRARVKAQRAAARAAKPPRAGPKSGKAIGLGISAGILMSAFYPLLRFGAWSDPGVGPYGTALLFGAGLWLSTLLLNPFFMYFPLQGKPIEIGNYLAGGKREHLLGLFAGIVWMIGALASFAAGTSISAVEAGLTGSYEIGQGAALLGALWGLLAWREIQGSEARVKALVGAALLCFAAGIYAVTMGSHAK
ncbi:MAG TPA: hypothetical protein VH639_01620 [Bryobacteraceae bacterium]|jgi:glucose uptake protein